MHPGQRTNICEHLLLGLSDVCERVRALTCDAAVDHVVLHRSQCRKLVSSYRVALQHLEAHVLQADDHQIHGRFPDRLDAKEALVLSLRAMLQAMEQGERFIRDCSGAGHTWLLKAVGGLALSTEAVYTHLHDLIWCIYIVTMAVERVLAAASLDGSDSMMGSYESVQDLPGWQCSSTIVAAIAKIWEYDVDHGLVDSTDEDLRSVLQVLRKLRADHKVDGNHACLADFLWKRLSDYMIQHNKFAHSNDIELPESLWIDGSTASLRQHIHDVVGEGAFAKVSKVEWLGGEFAMKDFFYVNEVQFGKEAAIQARLQHPNVLHLICCASGPNRCSMMMELMQEDLLSFINKRMAAGMDPPFSLLEAVDIMLQISKGMEHLHNLDVLHRDLKSNNILIGGRPYLDEDMGHAVQVKVADFGMAKTKQSSSMSSSRVQRGATRWRAPEAFLHDREEDDDDDDEQNKKLPKTGKYTKRADVYSFGMVCYEILTGKLPFATSKLSTLYKRVMAGERPTLPRTCPAALASLIRRCWHGNPLQRPFFAEISRALLYFKANLVLTNQTDVTISCSLTWMKHVPRLDKTPAAYNSRSLQIVREMFQCRLEDLRYKRSAQTGDGDHKPSRPTPHMPPVMEEGGKLTPSEYESSLTYSDNEIFRADTPAAPVRNKPVFGFLASFFCWERGAAKRLAGGGVASFSEQSREFSYAELELATRKFSRFLGLRGSSKVYWGKLPNGPEIAVKRLTGDAASRYRKLSLRELQILGSLRHRNLVPLLGWCTVEGPFLVYKFMPNGDLSTHLGLRSSSRLSGHNHHHQPVILSWKRRYETVSQLASALQYLHHDSGYTCIVHGDVRPENVLLDTQYWNARLDNSDLGLNILDRHELSRECDLSAGTPGFVDPYAWRKGALGASSDVYAFGVTALMVACGEAVFKWGSKRWPSGPFLRHWVYELYNKGELLAAADSRLRQCFDKEQMRRLLIVGLACTASKPLQRPTMQLVLDVLKGTTSYDLLNVTT